MNTFSAIGTGLVLGLASPVLAIATVPSGKINADPSEQLLSIPAEDWVDHCKKDGGRDLCIVALSSLRCHQYAFPLIPIGDRCSSRSRLLVRALDLKAHTISLEEPDGSFHDHDLTLIFATRLQQLMQEAGTQLFVKTLMEAVRRSGRDQIPMNLWEEAVKLSGGDEAIALERLAVLLQDTSRTRVQIFYLRHLQSEKKLSPETIETIGHLQVLQELIRDDRFRESGLAAWLTLYPRKQKLNETLNASPYHFYTMAYAAARMRKAGVSDAWASFLPFLFNTEYEFQQLDPAVWPMRNPRPFPVSGRVRWKLQDIYAGYTGALFGIGRLQNAEAFDSFTLELAADPKGKMRRIFFDLQR